MKRLLLVPVLALAVTTQLVLAQAVNTPASSLVVNANAAGTFPLAVLIGRLDPGLMRVDGAPGAAFLLVYGTPHPGLSIPGFGTLHVDLQAPIGFVPGQLDATGRASFFLPAGVLAGLPAGAQLALQAIVVDATNTLGWRTSGASNVTVVNTMASPIAFVMPVGSVARMRGPLMALGSNSVTLGNVTFNVGVDTEFANFDMLSDLQLGDWIVVAARQNAQGGYDAEEIGAEDSEPQVRITGRIQGIGPSGFAVLGVSVYTTTGTTYADDVTGVPATFADLMPGMVVTVLVPVEAMFPSVTSVSLNVPTELEAEPEPEPEPEPEDPPQLPAPSFCS